MRYEITTTSAFEKPQTFIAENESEKDEIVLALTQEQYLVSVKEIDNYGRRVKPQK